MPVVGLKEHQSVESHGDRHRELPLRTVERILVEYVVLQFLVRGIARFVQALLVHRNAVRVRPLVPEEFGAATAILRSAEVENAGPVALVDMDSGLLIVRRQRDPAASVGEVVRPRRSHGLPNELRNDLVQPFDTKLLDGIQARIPALDGIIHAEGLRPHLVGIPQEVVDDKDRRDHCDSLKGPGVRGQSRADSTNLSGHASPRSLAISRA